MKRSILPVSVTLAATMAFAGAFATASAAEHHASWSYAGTTGPAHWGDLEPDFVACKNGKTQSPVDIRDERTKDLAPIEFSYRASAATIVNNGHTIEVRPAAGGSAVTPTGTYNLVQFHFHAPSEYTVNGTQYPLAAHLVHRTDKGQLAVVGVLFKEGDTNKPLGPVFGAMPKSGAAPAELRAELDVADLLPKDRGYFALAGSLTTPPCTEGVQWYVLKQPVMVSPEQLAAFRKLYPMNARPVQPAHGRAISVSQ